MSSPPANCARPTLRSGSSSAPWDGRRWRSRSSARPRRSSKTIVHGAAVHDRFLGKRRRCAESPRCDPLPRHRDLPSPARGPANGLLRGPSPGGRAASPHGGSYGLGGWIQDYNTRAPHSALGMRSPAEYRAEATLSSSR